VPSHSPHSETESQQARHWPSRASAAIAFADDYPEMNLTTTSTYYLNLKHFSWKNHLTWRLMKVAAIARELATVTNAIASSIEKLLVAIAAAIMATLRSDVSHLF
jgi:hypothetical protein